MRRRDKQTITRLVLCSINNGKKRATHILYNVKMNNTVLKPMLQDLIAKSLVKRKDISKPLLPGRGYKLLSNNPNIIRRTYSYSLTEKGIEAVKYIKKVKQLLGEQY